VTIGSQRAADAAQRRCQVRVGEEDLRDVAGHQRHVHLQRRQGRCVTTNPADVFSSGLAARHVERSLRWVDSHDVETGARQEACKRSGSAADVEYLRSAQLAHDPFVVIEIVPRPVEVVVEHCQSRIREETVNHLRNRSQQR